VNTAIYRILILIIFSAALAESEIIGQAVPGKDENIPWLVTFGKNGETSWGDDDFTQYSFSPYQKILTGNSILKLLIPIVEEKMMKYRESLIPKPCSRYMEGKELIPIRTLRRGV
jgi:hypothetical protein